MKPEGRCATSSASSSSGCQDRVHDLVGVRLRLDPRRDLAHERCRRPRARSARRPHPRGIPQYRGIRAPCRSGPVPPPIARVAQSSDASPQNGCVQQVFAQSPGVLVFAHSARRCSRTLPSRIRKTEIALCRRPRRCASSFFDGLQLSVHPGGDVDAHTRVADTSPVRWARFFTPIFRCARGRALTSSLFM